MKLGDLRFEYKYKISTSTTFETTILSIEPPALLNSNKETCFSTGSAGNMND